MKNYVHGYSEREAERLADQARTLEELFHHDSHWDRGSTILEAGCGTGAQTKIVAVRNPLCHFVSIDISESSVREAKGTMEALGAANVEFGAASMFNLPFRDDSFDHLFVCFVLEHLSARESALRELKRVLKKNGTLMVIEGDHGSACFYPESREAQQAIRCQIELQARNGGDATIGRQLYPLLTAFGFRDVGVSPRLVYVDGERPEFIEGFTRNTFTAMIEGVRESALAEGLIDEETFDKGIADLYRTAGSDGVFCYTFFKAVARK